MIAFDPFDGFDAFDAFGFAGFARGFALLRAFVLGLAERIEPIERSRPNRFFLDCLWGLVPGDCAKRGQARGFVYLKGLHARLEF